MKTMLLYFWSVTQTFLSMVWRSTDKNIRITKTGRHWQMLLPPDDWLVM